MVDRTFFAFDNEALLDTNGDPIIKNSNKPNGTELAYQPGFTGSIITVDDQGGDPDVFDDDDPNNHTIVDGAGLVADGQAVESESQIILRAVEANGNLVGPEITLSMFSQGGDFSDVWGFSTNTTHTPGVTYRKVAGGNNGDSIYQDFVCFAEGVRLRTPEGWRAVEDIQFGDAVWTREDPKARVAGSGRAE